MMLEIEGYGKSRIQVREKRTNLRIQPKVETLRYRRGLNN